MKKISDVLKTKTLPEPSKMPVEARDGEKGVHTPHDPANDVQGLQERQIDAIKKGLPPRFQNLQPDFALYEQIAKSKKSFMLTGKVGTGKTRKMLEIFIPYAVKKCFPYVYFMDEQLPPLSEKRFRQHFKTVPEVLRTLRDEFDSDVKASLMDFMITTDILFLDDLGTENGTDWAKEQLFTVINERYNWLRPMVISTNLSFSEIAQSYGDRFASRLVEMCEKIEFTGKDWRVEK